MKRLISILIFCCSFINLWSQQTFKMQGTVDTEFNDQYIMLFSFKNDTIHHVDTATVKNGSFYFEGKEHLDDLSLLSLGNMPEKVVALDVVLEKGNIEVSIPNQRVEGTPLNDRYQFYLDTTAVLNQKIADLYKEQGNAIVKGGSPLYQKLVEAGLFTVSFKSNNIGNVVGKYFFRQEAGRLIGEQYAYRNDSAFVVIYNAADEEYRKSPWIQEYFERQALIKEKIKEREGVVGSLFLDFDVQTPTKESRKISNYVGQSKYLLIVFWASWCGPCIAEMPFLKELYEEFHPLGLDVLGISMDASLDHWKGALKRINVPWPNVSDLKGMDSALAKGYHIKGIPYAILVNKDGLF